MAKVRARLWRVCLHLLLLVKTLSGFCTITGQCEINSVVYYQRCL